MAQFPHKVMFRYIENLRKLVYWWIRHLLHHYIQIIKRKSWYILVGFSERSANKVFIIYLFIVTVCVWVWGWVGVCVCVGVGVCVCVCVQPLFDFGSSWPKGNASFCSFFLKICNKTAVTGSNFNSKCII